MLSNHMEKQQKSVTQKDILKNTKYLETKKLLNIPWAKKEIKRKYQELKENENTTYQDCGFS